MAMLARAFLMLLLLVGFESMASAQPRWPDGPADSDAWPTRSLAPYFLLLDGDPAVDHFPLLSTAADVTVSGVIADVRIKQVYKNSGEQPIEAVYVFPASTRAAVYGLKMTIGDRTIVAQVQERERARREYQQAKQAGRSASLLEQKRPNVLQMNVANLMPSEQITVELSYTELLVPVDSVYEFVFPTVVGPRYVGSSEDREEGNDGFTANPTFPAGQAPTYDLDLHMHLDAGMPLYDLGSLSHRVKIVPDGPTRALVQLDPSERAGGNRDFIFRYRLAGERIASGLVLAKGEEGGSFLLMVQPPRRIQPAELPPREYIFIMDVSGSMRGFPIEISKQLIGNLVSDLRPIDSFNIVLFESTSRAMAERSVPATEHNLKIAECFINSTFGGGGTELLPALKHALGLPRVRGASRTVVLATDGYVNVEAEAMRVAQQNLGNANLFAFGIGKSVNRFLIEAVARVGRGEPAIVADASEASERAEAFRRYVESPVLTGIKASFEGFATSEVEPASIPDVFASRPVVVYGKWSGQARGRIVVRGNTGGQAFEQSFDVASVKLSGDERGLRTLWARSRIDGLTDLEALHDLNDHRREITELGLRNSLLTKYTSFVAVDSQRRNVGRESITVRQPLPMPEGVPNQAVGGEPMSRLQASQDMSGGIRNMMQYERYEPIDWPRQLRRLTLRGSESEAELGVAVNATSDEVGQPVRVPFSAGFAPTNVISLGLHSREGLCLTGPNHGCAHAFNQFGIDVLANVVDSRRLDLALRFGFSFASFDPVWPRLALGAPMQMLLARNRLLMGFEPGLEWGLNQTDVNSAVFVLPLRLQLLGLDKLSLYASGGFQAAWSRLNQRYVVPAGIGVRLTPTKWLDLALEWTMVAKAGGEMSENARRIFYDSATTITPAIHDRSVLLTLRLHSATWAMHGTTDEDDSDDEDGDGDRVYHAPPPPPLPPPPECGDVEW